jgi:hypothetical protein
LKFSIYKKPTQTDIIIRNSTCHPHEHKLSSINFLLNRIRTYPLTTEAKQTEIHIIKNKVPSQSRKHNTNEEPKRRTKWATFTYCGKQVKQVTNFLKETQPKIAFHTQNTIENILRYQTKTDKYDNSGVY